MVFVCIGQRGVAALTSILAKIGIDGVNSTLATAVRTGVVLAISWGMVFLTHAQGGLGEVPAAAAGLLKKRTTKK